MSETENYPKSDEREITVRRYYKCKEGHYVIVDGSYLDPHNALTLELRCPQHESWMQPVPAPGEESDHE